VVSFTNPPHALGKSTQCSLYRALVGFQNWCGQCGEEEKFLPLPGIEPRTSSQQPVAIPTKLSRVHFFFLDYETIGTAATPDLLCQPRAIMKMIVESMMECRLVGETEVLGENLRQRHFCPSQNPTHPPGFEPGPPRWEAGD
jgi:hypothetical protein